jgi:hypothetical protein
MMKRTLALMLLAVVMLLTPTQAWTTSNTEAAPAGCAHCITDRNACQAACNGNAECLSICQSEYECCLIMCHGGSCNK